MPFPNEHAARLIDPGQFTSFRRQNDKGGQGVDFIFGIKDGSSKLQAVRFSKSQFTVEQAKKWLKDHDHTAKMFEPAGRSDEDDTDFDRVARFDIGEIRTDVRRTDEGYLIADATVSRTGVFQYRNPDGSTRRELRHPDDILRVDSLATLKLKPLTNGHPPTRLLNTKTARKFQVGTVGENVRSDTGLIKANLTVTDEGAISDIESRGRKFLSCGYTCDLVKEDGVHDGEPFTHRQTNVRYNHVALCDTPRAGTVARLNIDHLDGEDAEVVVRNDSDEPINPTQRKGRFMAHIVLDNITYEADQQVINELERVRGANVDLSSKLDAAEAERDTVKEELASTKTKLDEAEKRDIAAEVAAGVKARASLVTAATPHLDEDTVAKLDELSDKDIKIAVIKKKSPDVNLDEKSDAYIDARFDAVVELLKDAKIDSNDDTDKGGMANQRQKVHGDGKTGDGSTEPSQDKSRNDMADRMANAWKDEDQK